MRARQWILLLLLLAIFGAVLYYHGGEQTTSTPIRYETHATQENNATIYVIDENGNPLLAQITYSLDGRKHTIQADGKASIPENAAFARIYAKNRIPVTIRAITDGRKVVIPLDPTTIVRSVTFTGCNHVYLAPVGAPLVDQFDCNRAIHIPEGVYRFAATDNGCVVKEGNITLRKDRTINIEKNKGGCRRVDIYLRDAETGDAVGAWITANGIAQKCGNGTCQVGSNGRCVDVYAWREGYMRSYDHICDKNAIIPLNKAVDVEKMRIKTDGDEIVVTDRDGVVIHVVHESNAEFMAPDGSYYVFAERWPIMTKVTATIPGDANKSITLNPSPAKITVRAGETIYIDDAPACIGPKT